MVHLQPDMTCSIPWCWRAGDQPTGGQPPHRFCSHHWSLGSPGLTSRFLTVSRRRTIDSLWVHGAIYDDLIKRGRFLKLCHITLWAKEIEDSVAEMLRLDMINT